ncbi:magnesium transporter [Oribacterium sp. WCC10]|uniref:magnesium transporter n=1 Tax=Oribacterium sp. WCC10 TaxID=1855343 RepID=UPI0008DEB0C9|nr:magnesium transporter [Oribacterium sp. WCC10]SFG30107.1 magnesium transporter [Oribacterium sp. WCC10]
MNLMDIKELIEEKKYLELRDRLSELNEADIASILEEIDSETRIRVFRILPKDMAADVFAYLPRDVEQEIITALTDIEATNIINNMMSDDAADLMEEMPASVVKKLLSNVSADARRDINLLLKFPEDSAGSIMTVEFVDLKKNLTVQEAIDRIRSTGIDKETINTCYVLDNGRRLIGIVTLRALILSSKDKLIEDIMEDNVISVDTMMDQEDVARVISKYDFNSIPVVDSENLLVGIITVDDIVDIIQEEATEDIQKMAAIVPSDVPYMKMSIMDLWKKRVGWLLLLMVSATFTGRIINSYQDALGAYIVLAAYIPQLMDTGGNTGSQSSTMIIRALSLKDIEFKDIFKVLRKEFGAAMVCGVTLAAANFVKLLVVDKIDPLVASVICLTMIAVVIAANIVGAVLPMTAKKFNFDPAVMASPMLTTIIDTLALVIYFMLATHILHIG